MVLALSALYEVIEGAAALIINPELGTAFLDTQGDEWDVVATGELLPTFLD